MSVLAHVFEAAGIATIVLSSVREMAEKTAPPAGVSKKVMSARTSGLSLPPSSQVVAGMSSFTTTMLSVFSTPWTNPADIHDAASSAVAATTSRSNPAAETAMSGPAAVG